MIKKMELFYDAKNNGKCGFDIEYERFGVWNVRFWSRQDNFARFGARKSKQRKKQNDNNRHQKSTKPGEKKCQKNTKKYKNAKGQIQK